MATNQYVNKVVFGSTTLIDISDTTAVASDVASGKYFYNAAGAKVQGTASGGGGGSAVTITDVADSHGGTVRTITAVDISDTTAVAADVAQGKYFYTADGTKTAGTAEGGIDLPTFTGVWSSDWSTLTITCNKTFAECYDDAENAQNGAFFEFSLDDPVEPWNYENTATATYIDSTKIVYTSFGNSGPNEDVVYHSDGTIEYVQPSSMQIDLEVTQNGYYCPQYGVYTSVNVSVPSSTPTLQAKTNVTPTESSQTITPDSGYDALSSVQIDAISSTYVGSGITRLSSTDLTASGATVTVPAGYYENAASKSVASGTEGTPTATKGTVSNHAVTVTPSVTNAAGYISGGTHTGTGVSVSASELVSGTLAIDSSGTKDVTNYASASVPAGSVTAPSSISGTSASVSVGTNTLTFTKTVSVTPNVTTAGYISSGTAGNASVSLQASVTTQAAQTIHPSTTDQTIAASRYLSGAQTIKAVTHNLDASKILSGTTVNIGDSTDSDCVASVTGTLTFQTIYSGSSAPSSSTGVNGDIYVQA